MAARLLEDILCGALGYGIGSYRSSKKQEFSQDDVESLIHSYLSQVPLEGVIDAWIDANDANTYGERMKIANILKSKADEVF